jgi:hypothetical protein
MNRRAFLKFAGAGGWLAATWPSWTQIASSDAPPAGLAFTTSPVLQNPSATAMTISIGVNGPSTAWVEYGETEQLGRTATGARHGLNPYDPRVHHVRLEGLRPGQRHFYRVRACPVDFRTAYDIRRGEAITTGVFGFRTFDPRAREVRFAVWNDTHENATTLGRLRERTAPGRPDFLVWNGDVTNDNYRPDAMVEHYLGAGGQPFTRETPLLFVRGNHDTRGPAGRLASWGRGDRAGTSRMNPLGDLPGCGLRPSNVGEQYDIDKGQARVGIVGCGGVSSGRPGVVPVSGRHDSGVGASP